MVLPALNHGRTRINTDFEAYQLRREMDEAVRRRQIRVNP